MARRLLFNWKQKGNDMWKVLSVSIMLAVSSYAGECRVSKIIRAMDATNDTEVRSRCSRLLAREVSAELAKTTSSAAEIRQSIASLRLDSDKRTGSVLASRN
jgi:hypothetical protein